MKTFAFEINSIQKDYGEPIRGWFVSNNSETDWYHIIWPRAKVNNPNSVKEILYFDTAMINKETLKKKVASDLHTTPTEINNKLLSYAESIRNGTIDDDLDAVQENNSKNKKYIIKEAQNYSLCYSFKLPEKPINILIDRKELNNIATHIFRVTHDGYSQIR